MSPLTNVGQSTRDTLSNPIVLLAIAVGAATVGYDLGSVAAGASMSGMTPLVVGLTAVVVATVHADDPA